MISISWNPGQTPSLLAALRDARLAEGAAKAAAESYTDDIHDWIGAGHSFTSRTGQLAQSINWRPSTGGAVVYAQAETAPYIEFGTGKFGPRGEPYVIRPKAGRKALRIPIPGGGYRFAKSVIHPGIKPQPYFYADGAAREGRMLDAVRAYIARRMAA